MIRRDREQREALREAEIGEDQISKRRDIKKRERERRSVRQGTG